MPGEMPAAGHAPPQMGIVLYPPNGVPKVRTFARGLRVFLHNFTIFLDFYT